MLSIGGDFQTSSFSEALQLTQVKAGDRVVVSTSWQTGEDREEALGVLRGRGVEVDVREIRADSSGSGAPSSSDEPVGAQLSVVEAKEQQRSTDPVTLFRQYSSTVALDFTPGATVGGEGSVGGEGVAALGGTAPDLREAVLAKGETIILDVTEKRKVIPPHDET